MDQASDLDKVKDIIDKAKEVLVVTHEHPTFDSMGSSLALYLGLVSIGKKVTVACPDPVIVELSSFVGANKVVSELGKKNFVISLDYIDGSIEKVSYNIEGDKFNLVIEPRPGFEPFSQEKVHYSAAGVGADAIFVVDTIHLGGLKKLYESQKELFAGRPVVNIDRHPNNANFGQINFVNQGASSTAEIIAQLLSGLGVKLTVDIATNLLNALYSATDNFQISAISPASFELAAACLRSGGKKFSQVKTTEEKPHDEKVISMSGDTVVSEVRPKQSDKPAEAPADWLKPKIFKSSNIS